MSQTAVIPGSRILNLDGVSNTTTLAYDEVLGPAWGYTSRKQPRNKAQNIASLNPVKIVDDKIDFDPEELAPGEYYPVRYHNATYFVRIDPKDNSIELYKM